MLLYTDDDKICFENIYSEQRILTDYMKDCNFRKIMLFKISLAAFSLLTSGSITIFALYVKEDGITISFPFNYIFGLIVISIGLINFVIIKELLSIHASRLITLRQANSLRYAIDSIRYKKFQGVYPASYKELFDQSTEYWKAFGRHRKLPLENESLRLSERGIFRSPDTFMVLILTTMSVIVMSYPMIYLFINPNTTFYDGWMSGAVSLLFIVGVIAQFKDSKKHLRQALGSKSTTN